MRLPGFVKKISPIGETLEAIDTGTALLAEETEKRNRQVSVSMADTGLSLWEKDYAIPDGTGREENFRRARIRAAMAGSRTLTVAELEALAVSLAGADRGEVSEDFADWRVTLEAVYEGRIPGDVTALEEAVRRQKPAHLAVSVTPVEELRANAGQYLALTCGVYLEVPSREGNE